MWIFLISSFGTLNLSVPYSGCSPSCLWARVLEQHQAQVGGRPAGASKAKGCGSSVVAVPGAVAIAGAAAATGACCCCGCVGPWTKCRAPLGRMMLPIVQGSFSTSCGAAWKRASSDLPGIVSAASHRRSARS